MDIYVVEVARDVDSDLNIVFVDLVWVVALAKVVEGDNDDEVPGENMDCVEVDVNSRKVIVGWFVVMIDVAGDGNDDEVPEEDMDSVEVDVNSRESISVVNQKRDGHRLLRSPP